MCGDCSESSHRRSALWARDRAPARGVAPLTPMRSEKRHRVSCRRGFSRPHLRHWYQRFCEGRFYTRDEDAAAFLDWSGTNCRRIDVANLPFSPNGSFREANLRDGLNLVCWEGCFRPEYEADHELQRYTMSIFIQEHRGYRWKEVISSQSERADRLEFVLKTGGALWDPLAGRYTSTLKKDPSEIVSKPHIMGITRQGDWAGNWVATFFDYHPPMLGFNRSEQRLLSCALPGATDEQLAEMLGTSLPAVKKLWVSLYHRVERLPARVGCPIHFNRMLRQVAEEGKAASPAGLSARAS